MKIEPYVIKMRIKNFNKATRAINKATKALDKLDKAANKCMAAFDRLAVALPMEVEIKNRKGDNNDEN